MDSFEQARPDMPVVELTIRGEQFRFSRKGNAMKFATWLDAPQSTITNCPECNARIQIGSFRRSLDLTEASIELIETMLDPQELPRWRTILDDDEFPLTPDDLQKILMRALELISARPTVRPSDSSSTESETGTSSTAGSPSPAVAA
jgi:hypothetical protein